LGSSNQNVAPWPGALSTPMRPPCFSTMARQKKEAEAEAPRVVGGVARAGEAVEDAG